MSVPMTLLAQSPGRGFSYLDRIWECKFPLFRILRVKIGGYLRIFGITFHCPTLLRLLLIHAISRGLMNWT